ncbi:MAG: AraC family transcriptional regulator ligand-binding domain-containing protein, partial [Deltaproteobacteria bacterium]|nr:AraC family transcriptional regulator ligand-binding domain-containing protein [Deltaproteobacteria bacterium]
SGSRYHVTAYGIWGYAVMSSPTARDAVDLGLRYLNLTYAFSRFDIEERADRVCMFFDDSGIPEPAQRALVERDLSAVFHMWSELLGEPPPIIGLALRTELCGALRGAVRSAPGVQCRAHGVGVRALTIR